MITLKKFKTELRRTNNSYLGLVIRQFENSIKSRERMIKDLQENVARDREQLSACNEEVDRRKEKNLW